MKSRCTSSLRRCGVGLRDPGGGEREDQPCFRDPPHPATGRRGRSQHTGHGRGDHQRGEGELGAEGVERGAQGDDGQQLHRELSAEELNNLHRLGCECLEVRDDVGQLRPEFLADLATPAMAPR